VSNWLNEDDSSQWLMILDNADDADLFLYQSGVDTLAERNDAAERSLRKFLPNRLNARKSMVVTTRNRHVGEDLAQGEPCIDVGPFSSQEAQDLLRSKVREIINHVGEQEAKKLVEFLGHIPLAITQAAAYMNRNKISVSKYLAALEKDQQNLIDHLSVELQDYRRERGYPNSVFLTWRLSFEQIRLQEPRAAEVLSLMAMLDGQQIPLDLVQSPDDRDIDFRSAVGTLDGYSLISRETGDEVCAMHPLVQLSIQDWLAAADQKTHFTEQVLQLLAAKFPNGEHENRLTCELLLPHARAVLQHALRSKSGMRNTAAIFHNVAWFDWQQGRYRLANEGVRKAYDIRRDVLGNDNISTIGSIGLLGTVLSDLGKYKQAEEIHRQALGLRETVLGKEHPDTLTSMNNLAGVLSRLGKYKEAEEIHRQALGLGETVLGKEHPDTLTSMNNLAGVLSDLGKYKQAEEIHRQALGLRETVLGKEHPVTLTSMNNLAGVLSRLGKYKEAEEIHRQALGLGETVLGKEHPDTLTSMNNLARVLSNLGKYKQAEEIHRQVLGLRETVLGKEHPDTLVSMKNLALTLWNQERLEEAEELEVGVLETRTRVLGPEHPETLSSMANLAYTWKSQSRDEDAIGLMEQAEKLQRKILGSDHPNIINSTRALSKWLAAQEAAQSALPDTAFQDLHLADDNPS
jgi:tetratricopeptide (TPR) repeat protein